MRLARGALATLVVVLAGAFAACGLDIVGTDPSAAGASSSTSSSGGGSTSSSGAPGADGSGSSTSSSSGDSGTVIVDDAAVKCEKTICSGACVDTEVDPMHCGDCTTICTGQECSGGKCVASCSGNQTACGGSCCEGICVGTQCKNPELWLRNDIWAVSPFTWPDRTGHGYNVSQTIPGQSPSIVTNALNGRSVVHFDGNDRLEGPNKELGIGTNDFAWFHVSRSGGNTDQRNQVFGTIHPSAPNHGLTAGYGDFQAFDDVGYGLLRGKGASSGTSENFIYVGSSSRDQWAIVDLQRTGDSVRVSKNGVTIGTATNPAIDVTGGTFMVGTEKVDGSEYFTGDVAEIIIIKGAVNDSERSAILGYLSARHGISISQ